MHSNFFVPPAGSTRGCVHASSGSSPLQTRRRTGSSLSKRGYAILWAVMFSGMAVAVSGCGSIAGNTNAVTAGTLVASANALSFGNVTVGQTATSTVSLKNASAETVQISQISVAGTSFTLTSQNAVP